MQNFIAQVKSKQNKPTRGTCEKCKSSALKRKLATYPVNLTGKLAGRHIDVYRVPLDQCQDCGHLMPTPEGQAKIKRCVKTGIEFFLNNLP